MEGNVRTIPLGIFFFFGGGVFIYLVYLKFLDKVEVENNEVLCR